MFLCSTHWPCVFENQCYGPYNRHIIREIKGWLDFSAIGFLTLQNRFGKHKENEKLPEVNLSLNLYSTIPPGQVCMGKWGISSWSSARTRMSPLYYWTRLLKLSKSHLQLNPYVWHHPTLTFLKSQVVNGLFCCVQKMVDSCICSQKWHYETFWNLILKKRFILRKPSLTETDTLSLGKDKRVRWWEETFLCTGLLRRADNLFWLKLGKVKKMGRNIPVDSTLLSQNLNLFLRF